jgi:PTS system mannose-specific IIA component
VIAGVNLPMLVKLARVRGDLEIKQAVTMAAEAGRKYINVASESLGG